MSPRTSEKARYRRKPAGVTSSEESAEREPFTLAKRAAIRGAEIRRLAVFRREHGIVTEPVGFLRVALRTLAERRSTLEVEKRVPLAWPDAARMLATIGETLPAMLIAKLIAEADAGLAAALAARSYQAFKLADMHALKAGQELELSRAERDELRITTIEATDESREARAKRKKIEKAERDKAVKEAKRRADGAVPREAYEASSLSKMKPWEKFGVVRRTWEKWGKPDPTPANVASRARSSKRENVSAGLAASSQSASDGGPAAPTDDGWNAFRSAIAKQIVNLPAIRGMIAEAARSARPIDGESQRVGSVVSAVTSATLRRALRGGAS